MDKDLKFKLEQLQKFINENNNKLELEKIEKFNDLMKEFSSENDENTDKNELYDFINELNDEFGCKKRFVKLYKNVIDSDDIINTVDKLKEICKIKIKNKQEQ